MSSAQKKNLKQGSLFSFFSKKPVADASTTGKKCNNNASSTSAASSSSQSNRTTSNKPSTVSTSKSVVRSNAISSSNSSSSNSTNRHSVVRETSSSTSPKPKPLKASLVLLDKLKVGRTRIKVFWQEDRQYYACDVLKHREGTTSYCLRYDDGETEWSDLATQNFKILSDDDDDDDDDNDNDDDNEEEGISVEGVGRSSADKKQKSRNVTRKRRMYNDSDGDDDDEGENEWKEDEDDGGDDDDDESFSAEEESDADDHWMDTDDDDDSIVNKNKRPKKKKKLTKNGVKVTRHNNLDDNEGDVEMTPPQKSSRGNPSSMTTTSFGTHSTFRASTSSTTPLLKQFSYQSSSPKTVTSEKEPRPSSSTPAQSSEESSTGGQEGSSAAEGSKSGHDDPPQFERNVVNVRGSHVHNHLNFLRNPRDKQGRRPDHPEYDHRTLKVGYTEKQQWERVAGGAMTPAVEQWWDIKSDYFDTVLLFKTGKFYEMFHMDADVGVEVCGLTYMKGHVAHAGFPEISYGPMADKLVRHGYKVARVEQTETPEQLKIRKQRTPKGQKQPKAVNREVCSIMTLGTRTFCALDDRSIFLASNGEDDKGPSNNDGSGGCGPLLAISEILFDAEDSHDDEGDRETEEDCVRPKCEYGITIVDAVRGSVTLGQFADDVLRTRMHTLLMSFAPCEILIQGGDGTSKELRGMVQAYQSNSRMPCRIETIGVTESFPSSTALEKEHRRFLERTSSVIRPWDVSETLDELHRKKYFPRASRRDGSSKSIARWPAVMQAVIEGGANLCLSSFGAVLFYLQRNLIDQEILSMGLVKAYIPRTSTAIEQGSSGDLSLDATVKSTRWYLQQEGDSKQHDTASRLEVDGNPLYNIPRQVSPGDAQGDNGAFNPEDDISYMQMDGTTLTNLEILANSIDFKQNGSLWSKINHTKCPHGTRMLRAWLLRPLFRKADIERRADAVTSLATGAGALALKEARSAVMGKLGDLDRLLSRIHSVGCGVSITDDDDMNTGGYHPNDRAVLYEGPAYTKRKVQDFTKALSSLRKAMQIPEIFANVDLEEGSLLYKLVRLVHDGGLFPDMTDSLDWYFENFDCDAAANGKYEPPPGTDRLYDQACDTVARVKQELEQYKMEMIEQLSPRHVARSEWKYINMKPDSKDKYLIELPASIEVPDDFIVKGKRGTGAKRVNKYRTSFVAGLVNQMEQAIERQQERKAKGMQVIFAKFDSQRSLWMAAAHATAILDALGSLATVAGHPGYCRPVILDCPLDKQPSIDIVQGRHPCIADVSSTSEFVANDLSLGIPSSADDSIDSARLLLLSGPNMGGKSTLLRQTCLIAILAQIGCYVPAESCSLTPIDCIFTRLGASDRILLGQSTFFVELAETAAALRGATRRSLVIMDELGRGTSTFDGTAIASATVKHLVERSQCLSLFATHYHSLLDEFENSRDVRLGHMQCIVHDEDEEHDSSGKGSVVFLYTLGPGQCPKSFGINVAKLAGLPQAAVANAKIYSENFEKEMLAKDSRFRLDLNPNDASILLDEVMQSIEDGDEKKVTALWNELRKK